MAGSRGYYRVPPARCTYYRPQISLIAKGLISSSCFHIFTDGSTKKGHDTSGASAVIFSEDWKKVSEVGFSILAITVAAKAIPYQSPGVIYSDSLAAIAAAEGPPMSGREYVRTPCRGWLATLRDVLNSKPLISLRYVPAHTLGEDSLSKGNEMADRMAKSARVSCPKPPPVTLAWDGVFIVFEGKVLQKGVKEDLRYVQRHCRTRSWNKVVL